MIIFLNIVDPVRVDGMTVSSSLIRDLLEESDVCRAAKALGRDYSIAGRIVQEFRTGSMIGYPTANLDPRNELVPNTGVYAVRMHYRGKLHDGVANIGFNPTFKRDRMSIEIHVFDFSDEIYSREVDVSFSRELVRQISLPIEQTGLRSTAGETPFP